MYAVIFTAIELSNVMRKSRQESNYYRIQLLIQLRLLMRFRIE